MNKKVRARAQIKIKQEFENEKTEVGEPTFKGEKKL